MKNILLIGSILATSGFTSSLGNVNDRGKTISKLYRFQIKKIMNLRMM